VDLHGDVLYRYALARVRRPDVAEDVVQETLLAAWRTRGSFEGRSSERTWLIGILKHKVIDYLRRSTREQPTEEMDDRVLDAVYDHNGRWRVKPHPVHTDPYEAVKQQHFRMVLQECLDRLPERQSAAFVLREMDGLQADELCKVLGITATNLWVILHRARMRLRGCIEELWLGERSS